MSGHDRNVSPQSLARMLRGAAKGGRHGRGKPKVNLDPEKARIRGQKAGMASAAKRYGTANCPACQDKMNLVLCMTCKHWNARKRME